MQILTDWHLIGLILLITAGMVAILIIGSAIPQTRFKLSLESDKEKSNKFNVSYSYYSCIMTSARNFLLMN